MKSADIESRELIAAGLEPSATNIGAYHLGFGDGFVEKELHCQDPAYVVGYYNAQCTLLELKERKAKEVS